MKTIIMIEHKDQNALIQAAKLIATELANDYTKCNASTERYGGGVIKYNYEMGNGEAEEVSDD